MFKAYIKIDGRWCHVQVLEVYHQQNIFGEDVKMVRFKRTKNSQGIEEAERDRFFEKKPRESRRKKDTELA